MNLRRFVSSKSKSRVVLTLMSSPKVAVVPAMLVVSLAKASVVPVPANVPELNTTDAVGASTTFEVP